MRRGFFATTIGDDQLIEFFFGPYVDYATDTKVFIKSQVENDSTVYAVIVAAGDPEPSYSQIAAGQNSSGGAAISSSNTTDTGTGFTLTLTGLAVNTNYRCYLYGTDTSLNTPIESIDFSTISSINQLRNSKIRWIASGATLTGTDVDAWPNSIGYTQYNLAPKSGSGEASYVASGGLNSQPEIEFNATDQRLKNTQPLFYQRGIWVMIFKTDVSALRQMLLSHRIEDGTESLVNGMNLELQATGNFRMTSQEGSPAGTQTRNIVNPLTTGYHKMFITFDGRTNGTSIVKVQLDATTPINVTNAGLLAFGVTSAPRLRLAGWVDGTVLPWDGKIPDIIFFSDVLNADELLAVTNEINSRYGI